MPSASPSPAPAAAATPPPSTARVAIDTLLWALGQGPRLLRNNLSGFSPAWLKRFFVGASSLSERAQLLFTPLFVDPRVLQRLAHAFPAGFVAPGGTFAVVGAYDVFIKVSTTLRARGERTAELFFRSSQGSTFTAEPRVHGECPYGTWEERVPLEPHVLCQPVYPAQTPGIERLVDEYLSEYVGKTVEVGELMRPLVWDAMLLTSYGVQPSAETRRILAVFEAHTAEFDTSLRVNTGPLAPAWSDELLAQVKEMGDWTWKTTLERQAEAEAAASGDEAAVAAAASRTDVLSYALAHFPPPDLRAFDGALKALFTAGFNNQHCAITGALLANAAQGDSVYRYLASGSEGSTETDADTRVEHVVRETLRLHTSIPVGRTVQATDDVSVDGKKLATGGTVVLPTVAVNTEASAWERPDEFDASRFVGREDDGFMCHKGFAPFGAAAELGGRQCAARFYIVHLQKVMLGKMLCDYKMSMVGRGAFDFKQMIGSSQYSGHCNVRVEKRAKE